MLTKTEMVSYWHSRASQRWLERRRSDIDKSVTCAPCLYLPGRPGWCGHALEEDRTKDP
jgi:hypothetical protein